MERTFVLGLALTVAGLVGYGVGVSTAYPGRELTLVGIMVGLTLTAVGLGGGGS
ncbi:hypothetical protein [Haloarchaeobius litoreus]|uniref:PEP-CTERM protein-sorting domain-containing protein n=1 Tax=Haloarchaeobius litoreus TaxID=755306 RepID=A0ABD6DK68_9EURY|nr:hypothetical protein [Haloarchaeobius litoreus]